MYQHPSSVLGLIHENSVLFKYLAGLP